MKLSRDELLSKLRQMDGGKFESLIADVWEERGWKTTETPDSRDRGIDIIAKQSTPFKQKQLIQAKRWAEGNKISSRDVQQYDSLRRQESDVDAVIIVTTSSFTSQAEQIANELNVKAIDGRNLCDVIFSLDSQRFLSDYFNTDTIKKPYPKTRAREVEKAFTDFYSIEIDLIGSMSPQEQIDGFSRGEGITTELSDEAEEIVYSGFKHINVQEQIADYLEESSEFIVEADLSVRQIMATLIESGAMERAWNEVHEKTLKSDPNTQLILGLVFLNYSLGRDTEKEDV
ncbi:restriction endonuclease [Halonotius sp. F2-221B]|uniref:restriction endonuclease n=1 Tax=Halonotius sp. F2-221B TaxID=2731620 RepID=UPI00398B9E17